MFTFIYVYLFSYFIIRLLFKSIILKNNFAFTILMQFHKI